MQGAVKLELINFLCVYLLLIIAAAIMKKSKIKQTGLLITASLRMTVQLIIAGLVLTYIFENRHPALTAAYIALMVGFAIYRVLSKNKDINKKFKTVVALSIALPGVGMLCFFVGVVVGKNVADPQYMIPIGGMIIGNTMTGMNLGIKSFRESVAAQRSRINTLLNIGAHPRDVLAPFVSSAVETALLPTLNSMVGMGIVSLPGMMTGQILSGTLPTTAILYQIAIMITICTTVCVAVWASLYFGHKTLYNNRCQMI